MVIPLYAFVFSQVVVKVMVPKIGAVIKIHGDGFPLQFKVYIGSMRLLLDTFVNALLRITYFQPSVVTCNLRSAVGIHHPDKRVETMYLRCVHHDISFTLIRMKFRSRSSNPYLSNS